jgi:hypothetical protein
MFISLSKRAVLAGGKAARTVARPRLKRGFEQLY